jgi:hypothetical protein
VGRKVRHSNSLPDGCRTWLFLGEMASTEEDACQGLVVSSGWCARAGGVPRSSICMCTTSFNLLAPKQTSSYPTQARHQPSVLPISFPIITRSLCLVLHSSVPTDPWGPGLHVRSGPHQSDPPDEARCVCPWMASNINLQEMNYRL